VKAFEKEFIDLLKVQNKQILDNFRAGKFEDADVVVIKKVATELAAKY
jgi:F-type H+-transporting ATPase subunit alpha